MVAPREEEKLKQAQQAGNIKTRKTVSMSKGSVYRGMTMKGPVSSSSRGSNFSKINSFNRNLKRRQF